MKKSLTRAAAACCALLALSGHTALAGQAIPERLSYQLEWNGVKVGSSSIETSFAGETLEIVSRVDSEPWSAPFYKVENVETSRLERIGKYFFLRSYKMKLHEGRNDWYRAVGVNRNKKSFEFVDLLTFQRSSQKLVEPAWDPVSSLYFIRQQPLAVGKAITVDVLDQGKLNRIKVNVLRRETVTTPAGSFRTVVISPEMNIESRGLFYAGGPLTIWLTDDSKRVPVVIQKRIQNLFKDGVPAYLQQFTPEKVRNNIPRMETIRAELVEGRW